MHIPSLVERLQTRFKAVVPKPTFKCCRPVTKEILDEGTGVVHTEIEYKTFDRREEMAPYKFSDFSLHNLIAIGAPLNDVKMSHNNLAQADALAEALYAVPESVYESFTETKNE